MSKAYLSHLKSPADLKTTYEAIRAGFVALALEKNIRATPYVAQARALKEAASETENAAGLLTIALIQPALMTAAGISDKAANHLQADDMRTAILGLIKNFLDPAGANFVEELIFRFLLIRGDTLGGSMRNAGGAMAQCKLTRSVIAHLKLARHLVAGCIARATFGRTSRQRMPASNDAYAGSVGKTPVKQRRFSTM